MRKNLYVDFGKGKQHLPVPNIWEMFEIDPSIPQEENENRYQIYLDFDELRLHVVITRVNKKNENAAYNI